MKKLTQKRLKEVLHYDPETGIFTRKITTAPNAIKGMIAGSLTSENYLTTMVDKQAYLNHRLAWLYVYGYFPENEIDHINRIKTDNQIKNLREVAKSCNIRNRGNQTNNTSGIKGVDWYKPSKKWRVQISINNKNTHVCLCPTFTEAVCARLVVEQCLNWNKCYDNSPAYQYVQKMLKKKKLPRIIV